MNTRRIPPILATIGIAGYLLLKYAFQVDSDIPSFFLGLGVASIVLSIICIIRDFNKKD